jgi:hypothetical protein
LGKLLILDKFIFFVFSVDINEKRRHVHVRDKTGKINKLCKFWIEPDVELVKNIKFTSSEINELGKLISENIHLINKQLDKFYAGKKVKSITL